MSAQPNLNASQFIAKEPACLNHWPAPGWRLIASPSTLRYVQLQRRAEHLENRHFDLTRHLMQLYWEEQKGIDHRDHRARITRVERLAQRAGLHASAALEELFTEGDRLRGVSASSERGASQRMNASEQTKLLALLAAARRYGRVARRHAHHKARYDAIYQWLDNEYTKNDDIGSAHWHRLTRLSGLASRIADQFINAAQQLRMAHANLLAAVEALSATQTEQECV